MNRLLVMAVLCVHSTFLFSQIPDSIVVHNLFTTALRSTVAYNNLKQICFETPHRLAGSAGSAKALEIFYNQLKAMNPDTLYRQEVVAVPWERGTKEIAWIKSGKSGKINVDVLSLGGSVGTGKNGIKSGIIEVQSFDELAKLGAAKVKGKIVFFNFAMDPGLFNPSEGNGKAAFQRVRGASEAAKYEAVGCVVRSLTNSLNDEPHTGIMHYVASLPKIPAIAISTNGAEQLSSLLKSEPALEFYFKNECQFLPAVKTYNIIAELRGVEKPQEIITVGGHSDSWDIGQGAHDDGAGCVQSMEVLRLFKQLNIRPKRTLRVVLFIDEEMNQVGARKYAATVGENGEKIYAALESDSGAGVPRGFGCTTTDERFTRFTELKKYFEKYGIYRFYNGGGGVDIGPLKQYGVPLMNLYPDPQRYFDYHHSANDTFDKISNRELQIGSAAMAALIYLIDQLDVFR